MTPSDPVPVQLVDDHALIREGLRRALERGGEFVVTGESASLSEARARLRGRLPRVLVVDLRLPDGDGLDLVREAVAADETVGVVVVSMYGGDEHLIAAMNAGASAFVSKDAPAGDVVTAVRRSLVSPRSFRADGIQQALARQAEKPAVRLTDREQQVLELLADGLGVSAISRHLFISESTTKTHVAKIYDKLGASNRAQAIMAGLRLGVIKSPGQP